MSRTIDTQVRHKEKLYGVTTLCIQQRCNICWWCEG